MEVNLIDIRDKYGLEGNWWFHINSENFGFHQGLKNISEYEVEEDDILYLKQRVPEGFFETIWFVVRDGDVVKASLSDVKGILSKSLMNFITEYKKLPFSCVVSEYYKNKSVKITYAPTQYDKVIMKFTPADLGMDEIHDFFRDLESNVENPISDNERKIKPQFQMKQSTTRPQKSTKNRLFAANQKITILRGKITNIQQNTRTYQEELYNVFILRLEKGVFEIDGEEHDFEELYAQISENLYNKHKPQIGMSVYCTGRTHNDWTLGSIVHNIRTIKLS